MADDIFAPTPITPEERNWCVGAHLASFLGMAGLQFGAVLGPLVVWLIKRSESPAVDAHGKAVLNFQISIFIWSLLCIPLLFVMGIGAVLLIVLAIIDIVSTILGAIAANEGRLYKYRLTIRFLK